MPKAPPPAARGKTASVSKAARPPGAGKPTRADRRIVRQRKRQARSDQWRNLLQAFTMTRRNDRWLVPLLVATIVAATALLWVIGSLLLGQPSYLSLPIGVLLGLTGAMLLFSRRAQVSAYQQAEGRPGAAAFVLDNLRGDWRISQAVAGTAQLDAVHRLIGRPGIVLVAEGNPGRIRGLVAQEKRKLSRVAGDTPIYDVLVGNGPDQVPLRKLNSHLVRLPRNLSAAQVGALDKRIAALGGPKLPLPHGPMPQGAKLRNVGRTVRRRA